MSLLLSINTCVKANCTELIFSETTGVYSESNLGGYGTPNIDTTNIDSIELVITAPNGSIYTLTDVHLPDFPTSDSNFEFSIPLSLLGNRTKIEDGYWVFEYTVTHGEESYTATIGKVFTCSINCCIQNLLYKIKNADCSSCDNKELYSNYIKAIALRDSLNDGRYCNDLEYITKTLDVLQRLCRSLNCNKCN